MNVVLTENQRNMMKRLHLDWVHVGTKSNISVES